MGTAEIRALLINQNPFVLGKYPDRPAPAHVLNGFVAASLGVSDRGAAVRELIESKRGPMEGFESLDGTGWSHSPDVVAALRQDLSVIFNPDRRMWEDVGSPVPVHGSLATADPSDDGLGRALWSVVRANRPKPVQDRLRELLVPSQPIDPVTACASILAAGAAPAQAKLADERSAWYTDKGTPSGQLLGKNIADFLLQLTTPTGDARRLARIQHLGRGLYLTALIALFLGPLAAARKQSVKSVDQIGALVAWGGMPPGPAEHPMVEAAARSFQRLVDMHVSALASVLSRSILTQRLPSQLPVSQKRRLAFVNQLLAGGMAQSRVGSAIDVLCRDAKVSIAGDRPTDISWYVKLIESAYSPSLLAKGLRSMGRKVGLAGPDRGAGKPRFLCETPLLGTLVAGLCPAEGMPFEQFVDRVRLQLGIVIGVGSDENVLTQLDFLWESTAAARRILRDNQEALKHRMVRAGLAREYSDGHTEVVAGG